LAAAQLGRGRPAPVLRDADAIRIATEIAGRRLVMTIARLDDVSNIGDVWTYDFASQRMNRLTFDGFSLSPSWAPNGRTVAFTHREAEKPIAIYRVAADGSRTPAPHFTTALGNPYEVGYTPDGKSLVFRVAGNLATAPWDTFWDVSPDGSRFVFVRQTRRAGSRLTVLVNAIGHDR
jgi:Tol biopolymer transport system component